ncbi:kinase-like domain-containing protein [Cantharellus anzutake]|uniref:kinase-like domain-containing protein n=1 Tax=Cantharellus anzutake TaxID=1750568 RepID=UPI001906FCC9|nr:kinase-like domain-containing protein [Cantharellus anzutake]KAF8332078.1 kinase-like domain-containing protein [Cantharellus anzutake]
MDDDEQDYGGYYGRLQPENNHFTDLRGDLNPTVLPGIPTVTPHNAHKYGRNVDDDNSDHNPRPRKTGADASSLDDVRVYVNSIEAEHQRTLASKGPNSSDSESISTTWHNWSEDSLEELGRLGEGAGGAVYKVRDIESGLIMAKKSIPGTIETTPKQLIRELEFLKGCVHENITTFYGAFVTKPESERGVEVCVLMEFGEGGSLDAISHQIQKKGLRVSEKVVGKVAIGILSGLDYLHSKKVVHRDIKPSNILLTRKGVVKLCDFGVSGDLVQSEAKTFLGTGYYMAPERITGQSYSIRAEVWSTGITLIEFAQNEFPYPPNLSHFELVDVIVRSPPPQLDEGEVDGRVWSELMRDFIRVCLTVEAADRPPPKEMLKHEWILKSEKEKLNMKELVRDIWGWEKSKKKRKEPKRMDSLDAGVASGEDEGKDGEF